MIFSHAIVAPLLVSGFLSLAIAGPNETNALSEPASVNLVDNGSFESGFRGWTRWGRNSDLISLESAFARSGTNCAQIQHGHNALYFTRVLDPNQAYELRFFYKLKGEHPAGQVGLGFFTKNGPMNSGGSRKFRFDPKSGKPSGWTEFLQVFMPSAITYTCQFSFTAVEEGTLWIDDVSLKAVVRPLGLVSTVAPFEALKHRTTNPLFNELLTTEPGNYSIVSWAHDLNPKGKKGLKSPELENPAVWQAKAMEIFKESGDAGMGFLDLPGRLDGNEPWRTPEFHRKQFEKYRVRYDVWTEGSESIAAAVKGGAEILNPSSRSLGARTSVSLVDPAYIEAQSRILKKLGTRLKDEPFVGFYYGKDEPRIHIPEGIPERWGAYGKAMAKDVREQYGFGRFEVPLSKQEGFLKDSNRRLRWIAYNRWANDRFIESRARLSRELHEAAPGARYSPANYCFMGAIPSFDYSRLAGCSDLMECDPYASSGERTRGRGVFNHGFGAKFMHDLTGKPVRIIAQAFNYAGYSMSPDDLREWVSQSLRCGASAINYYEMDSPRWTDPDRWKMMLHLSSVVTRMNRIALPETADTAVLYTLYTHMSDGPTSGGDQVYAAHALVGEMAGSWFQFVSDVQLERGERTLRGFKIVYLPRAEFMTPIATKIIEEYVNTGGVVICGDARAFSKRLDGTETTHAREQFLGFKTAPDESAAETNDIVLKMASWGVPVGTHLPLYASRYGEEDSELRVDKIASMGADTEVMGTFANGSPAIISHKLGQGRVISFAVNPFSPRVVADSSPWPALIRGLQQSFGCKTDQPIWHFLLPALQK